MKFIIVALSVACLFVVNSLEYKGEDAYYDEWSGKSYQEDTVPEELTRPDYNINDAPKLFKKFMADYNKSYKTDEEYVRHYETFVKNLETIIRINKEGHGYVVDIDLFTDLSAEEKQGLFGVPDTE